MHHTADSEEDRREKVTAPDFKKKPMSFVHLTSYPQKQIKETIESKARLMAEHYNLSDTIGHHGEDIVEAACKNLGYTDLEIRKEKHENKPLGIAKRDIDVWGKPPRSEYFQNIEVKNRRDPLKESEVRTIFETTELAEKRWRLNVKSAAVIVFAQRTTTETAKAIGVPIAFSDGVYVPVQYRSLYQELNSKLALNVIIADSPSDLLTERISTFIIHHRYK